jgi:hypothetical protein
MDIFDLAIQTNDKEWFKELSEMVKGVKDTEILIQVAETNLLLTFSNRLSDDMFEDMDSVMIQFADIYDRDRIIDTIDIYIGQVHCDHIANYEVSFFESVDNSINAPNMIVVLKDIEEGYIAYTIGVYEIPNEEEEYEKGDE